MTGGRTTKGSSGLKRVIGVSLVFMLVLFLVEIPDAQAKGGRGRSGGSVRHSGGGANRGHRSGGDRAPSTTGRRTSHGESSRGPAANPGTSGRGRPSAGQPHGGRRQGGAHRADRRYSARKDARRDYYRFRTINHLIRVGVRLATRPTHSTTVVVTGTTYYYAGGVYYVRSGSHYVVVSAPPSAVVYAVPTATTVVYAGEAQYYYYGGSFYVATTEPATTPESPETTVNVTVNVNTDDQDAVVQSTMTNEDGEEVELPALAVDNEQNYEVVGPPLGATVPYLPEEAVKKTIGSMTFYVFEGTYYQPFASGDDVIYMVVEDPEG